MSETSAPTADVNPEPVKRRPGRVLVDARGQRFGSALSVVMLGAVLVTIPGEAAAILLTLQGVAFGLGGLFGLKLQPYGWVFRAVVRPFLKPPTDLEDEAPPRFAQLVGFAFVIVALFGLSAGLETVTYAATAFALLAAFLNAAFGLCLGCEMYVRYQRISARRRSGSHDSGDTGLHPQDDRDREHATAEDPVDGEAGEHVTDVEFRDGEESRDEAVDDSDSEPMEWIRGRGADSR